MRKTTFAILAVLLAGLVPAVAQAKLDGLDPSVAGSPITAGKAIMEVEGQLITASLPERAYGGTGAPSPIGLGDKTTPQLGTTDPTTAPPEGPVVGFPTHGNTYAVLSSGQISSITGPSVTQATQASFDFPNQFPSPPSPDRGAATKDYTVLKLAVNVPAGRNCAVLDYRFLSEEFPEYVGKSFNDAFIAEATTSNWSVGSGGVLTRPNDFAVSPSGVPASVNGAGPSAMKATEAAGTVFDGATGLVTTKTPIASGTQNISLSIFDASDNAYDSAAFLDNLRFTSESAATCKPLGSLDPTQPGVVITPGFAPSSTFVLGSSIRFGGKGTSASFTVTVPGPGVLAAGSTAAGAARARAATASASASKAKDKGKKKAKKKKSKKKKKARKAKKALLTPSTVRATKAGPVTITVRLSATGKKVLAKKGKLTMPVTIVFTPVGGKPSSQTRTVTFKKPAPKCGKKSKSKKCKSATKKGAKKKGTPKKKK